jgi:hypothetical protein
MSIDLRNRVRGLRHVKITSATSQVLIEEPVNFLGAFKLNGRTSPSVRSASSRHAAGPRP